MSVYRLNDELVFPDPGLADPNGLVAVGGDLSPERLLFAYSIGIFPWFNAGDPPLWWSPDPRSLLFPEKMHLSRSLRRAVRRGTFSVTVNRDFAAVVNSCATIKRGKGEGTWITAEMEQAYGKLHRLGYAHSIECYREGELEGGVYGVGLGPLFFGESMFSRCPDASKVALLCLTGLMALRGGLFVDCQIPNPHLVSLGAVEYPRQVFLQWLREAGLQPVSRPLPSCVFSGGEDLDPQGLLAYLVRLQEARGDIR